MLTIVSYSLYHSANSYLGVTLAARALRGLPVAIERRPLCVPKERGLTVADLVGGREGRGRGDYNREDCARWAAHFDVELRLPEPHAMAMRMLRWQRAPLAREALPARAYYAAVGSGREAALDTELFRSTYVEGLDPNEEETVRQAAAAAGLEPDALLVRAREPEAGLSLARALADFDRDACPGVPTWVVGGERFWGKDRVDWLVREVEHRLAG